MWSSAVPPSRARTSQPGRNRGAKRAPAASRWSSGPPRPASAAPGPQRRAGCRLPRHRWSSKSTTAGWQACGATTRRRGRYRLRSRRIREQVRSGASGTRPRWRALEGPASQRPRLECGASGRLGPRAHATGKGDGFNSTSESRVTDLPAIMIYPHALNKRLPRMAGASAARQRCICHPAGGDSIIPESAIARMRGRVSP
jgi:hypothetical protein